MARRRVNADETPQERFKRVAEARANAVLEKLRLLGNCANRQIYAYTDEDVTKIFSAISRQVRGAKAKFNSKRPDKIKLR